MQINHCNTLEKQLAWLANLNYVFCHSSLTSPHLIRQPQPWVGRAGRWQGPKALLTWEVVVPIITIVMDQGSFQPPPGYSAFNWRGSSQGLAIYSLLMGCSSCPTTGMNSQDQAYTTSIIASSSWSLSIPLPCSLFFTTPLLSLYADSWQQVLHLVTPPHFLCTFSHLPLSWPQHFQAMFWGLHWNWNKVFLRACNGWSSGHAPEPICSHKWLGRNE